MSFTSTGIRACRVALIKGNNSLICRPQRMVSTTRTTSHHECDIVIVGGGPVGLALASALSSLQTRTRQNLHVVLVEASDLSEVYQWLPLHDRFSNRVSSLTNASQSFLRRIGAWDRVETKRTTPIDELQVWDGVSDARITFSASEIDSSDQGMAKITENLNLQRGLLRHLKEFPPVHLLDKAKVQSILRDTEEGGGWPMVHLDNGQILRARLLVGADGFNSPVRAYAQIPSFGWSYDSQGIVATMDHPPRGTFEKSNTTAYQRFLPTGPIAFLPLSPTASSLVWSTRPHLASALISSEPGVLTSMINAAFRLPEVSLSYLHDRITEAYARGTPLRYSEVQEEILWRAQSHAIDANSAYSPNADGVVGVPPDSALLPPLVTSLQAGTVASFPLRFNHTESYIGEGCGSRTVLIGDAAHTIHPLAGQGLNMGLADAECLVKCIEQALLQGGDVGSYTTLFPYTRERYLQNHTLMGAIDKLHKLYSTTFGPLVWARSVGAEVLNELDSVKAALMITAGAQKRTVDGATAWSLAAKGMETLVSSANTTKNIGGGLGRMLAAELLKATTAKDTK